MLQSLEYDVRRRGSRKRDICFAHSDPGIRKERCGKATEVETAEICSVHDYGIIGMENVGTKCSRLRARLAAIKEIDSRCGSGIGNRNNSWNELFSTGAT